MFHKKLKVILENRGWKGRNTPSGLLDMWEGFVEDCESGYFMGIYEFDNDLSVRDVIELVLKNDSLKSYIDYKDFRQNVSVIDEKFKELLSNEFFRHDKENWWSRGILSKASGEYIEDIKEIYSFKVKKIDL